MIGGVNNKQPWGQSIPTLQPGIGGSMGFMGGGRPGLGSLLGMLGGGMGGGMGGQGLPSGYARPPAGVPFQQNPYTPFGSGFGLGLPYWASGFGRGPQFPSNLWTPPGQGDSPQSQVTPPGGGAGAGGGDAMDMLRFNQTGEFPGGGQSTPSPMINPAHAQGAAFQGAPSGFQGQFQDTYGQNAVPQFAANAYQQWLDNQG